MSQALTRSRDHLLANRRLILGHTMASSLAALVPIPYVSDWLPARVRRDLVKRIAESRGVDVDEDAVRVLAEGEVKKPGWQSVVSATPLMRFASRSLRAMFVAWNLLRAGDGAARTFALNTLFDHYCARMHVGGEIGVEDARVLRRRLERAVGSPAGSVLRFSVARAFAGALEAARRAPLAVLEAVRGKRPQPEGEIEAEEITDEALAELEDPSTPLGRTAGAVERRLAGPGRGYIEALVDTFERSDR